MTFLVTGAGRGIGLELCLFALESGHNVMAIVRDPNNARNLSAARKEYGDKLLILKGDVTSDEDLKRLASEVGDRAIDILINNAGVLLDDGVSFEELSREDLQQTFLVNTFAPLMVTQTFLPMLKKSSAAKLVNITSMMGSVADNKSGGYYAYRMSKAALNMFNKSFSVDHPAIVAMVLHPGWVRTEMGGAQAPVLPRESARGLFKLILESGKTHSGRFFDYTGKELPW
jgi:NAD(P)-dependent dehydrogenase (short-subunit alcohol dehydrogenase family)